MPQSKEDLLNSCVEAVCYSGFRKGQHPDRGNGAKNPSSDEILEDLKILSGHAGFKLIRLYDCEENTEMTLSTIKKNNLDIKVLLGIWLNAELSNHETCAWLTEPIPNEVLLANKQKNLTEITKGIQLANEYNDIVIAVNVGNEALVEWNDHKVHPDTIISYVKTVKANVKQQVTVAENYRWWADHGKELASVVDFLAIHIYPVWEGKDIDEALTYSMENILLVQKALPGKTIAITEAGWPTVASEFPQRAGQQEQKTYYSRIMKLAEQMNISCFFFEAFDEDWKGNPKNPDGAEKHWGLYTIDRKPKKVMIKEKHMP